MYNLFYEKKLWLSQFNHDSNDLEVAEKLLEECRFIEVEDMRFSLSFLIEVDFPETEKYAFYVERELKKYKGKVQRMYKVDKIRKQKKRRYTRRAYGAAIQAVQSKRYDKQNIGSEGVLANIISKKSQFFKFKNKYFLQPSVDTIRREKIKNFVIVTDLIGSGQRIIDMIESLWMIETIKSWFSLKYIRLHIACYACTERAERIISNHPFKPQIHKVLGECPTIWDRFSDFDRKRIITLCEKYGSFDKWPLGYEKSGLLISFEHSKPNNIPAILRKDNSTHRLPWRALFPEAYNHNNTYDTMYMLEKDIYERLGFPSMQQIIKKKEYWYRTRCALLILIILYKGYRYDRDIFSLTKASGHFIAKWFNEAWDAGYVRYYTRSITKRGYIVLNRLIKENKKTSNLEMHENLYYPQSLRAPRA
ncbi:phosphoribosyltransferase-like protein [Pectobacterium colocasium]|uniref:phosphoribosyltransferase-like protein n=1 Tax=Pectobacterium colocasium TaxID=2878098 RepID=UPI003B286C1B